MPASFFRSLIAATALCAAVPAGGQEALPEPGKPAAMFRLLAYNPQTAGGAWVGLDKFVGEAPQDKGSKLLVLSFMASFCAPCKKEMPALQKLFEKYSSDGLRVVLVSIDGEPEGMRIIEELIAANQVTFPVLKDRTTLASRRWLGPQSPLPSLFFIKPNGVVSRVHRGYDASTSAKLEAEIRADLGKAP